MTKRFKKIVSFVLVCLSITGLLCTSVSGAGYVIPDPENFSPGKAAAEIESIVNNKSVIVSEAVDNKITIDGEAVAAKHQAAAAEMQGYINQLAKRGMYLNRNLVNIVTVRINNIDFSEFVEIEIDSANISKMAEINTLKIVLQNYNEFVALDNEALSRMASNPRLFRIQIKKLSGTYTLRFLDIDDNIIEKYDTDIKIGLPSTHREQTVYLFANNTQENWGGQYNPYSGAMEFMTKYTGEYTVASPDIEISDIDELTEYEQQAIRFMVVRGYFNLQYKKFNPSAPLTRYDFAESLVRMFFALDNDAKCTFPDVSRNSRYYRYVAASQQDNIVLGYEDGKFHGNDNVLVQEVVALTARTINNKNGYVYPENIKKYIENAQGNYMEEWAEKEVALAVREGIYSWDMNLNFMDTVTRKDAAVMLYRLFMIMNNTPEPAESIEYAGNRESSRYSFWNLTNTIIVCSAMVVLNIVVLVLSFLIRKKRKTKK